LLRIHLSLARLVWPNPELQTRKVALATLAKRIA
jgi:hypothetical protein